MTLYLCNGKKDCINKEHGCYKFDNSKSDCICMHTTDQEYAINEPCFDPENHPDRFDTVVYGSGKFKDYVEKENYHGD